MDVNAIGSVMLASGITRYGTVTYTQEPYDLSTSFAYMKCIGEPIDDPAYKVMVYALFKRMCKSQPNAKEHIGETIAALAGTYIISSGRHRPVRRALAESGNVHDVIHDAAFLVHFMVPDFVGRLFNHVAITPDNFRALCDGEAKTIQAFTPKTTIGAELYALYTPHVLEFLSNTHFHDYVAKALSE